MKVTVAGTLVKFLRTEKNNTFRRFYDHSISVWPTYHRYLIKENKDIGEIKDSTTAWKPDISKRLNSSNLRLHTHIKVKE